MQLIENEDQISNKRLAELYKRWALLVEGDTLPDKSCVNEKFLEGFGGYCKLSTIEVEPFRVYYNAVGEVVKRLYNSPIEGKYLDQVFDPWIRKTLLEAYKCCADEATPISEKKSFSTLFGEIGYEYILLPFSKNGNEVHSILSCVFPLNKNIEEYADWGDMISVTPWFEG